jgi:hypothetical protein
MPAKRNDLEENTVDREMALTRITFAWVVVLSILFWATAPSPENRLVRFPIHGSLGGDVACAASKGECAGGTEMIRTAMLQVFHALRAKARERNVHE